MTNPLKVRRFSIVSLTAICAVLAGVAGCGGGAKTSSSAIPLDSEHAPALAAQRFPAGVDVTGSGPWKSVSLGYTPNTLVSAALSANSSIWFADQGANLIGEITASGTTTRYNAGTYPSPISAQARPTDLEAGPNNTTYYLTNYGFGVMSATGTATLYSTYCFSNCVGNAQLEPDFATVQQMAVSSDGSAWIGAEIYNAQAQTYTPAIIRAIGSSVSTIVVPGWNYGTASVGAPAWLTIGPDGNVWFTDGQAIGTISVATNAVRMFSIPAKYVNAANGWAGDITSAHGALWVSYVNNSSHLLRISTTGVITGVFDPTAGTNSGFNGIQSSHGLAAGPNNTLYAANGDWLISSFNITTSQFSSYYWPNQGVGGGAQTIAEGADSNMWALQSNYGHAHVFFPTSTISTVPASLTLKVGSTATIDVKEGNYTGTFTSLVSPGCGASATQSSSSGIFTVQAGLAGPSCYISFSDTIGNGTVYVKVTVSQ